MKTKKTHTIITLLIVVLLIVETLPVITVNAEIAPEVVKDYIHVVMKPEYSSPEENYTPEYYGKEYVLKTEALNEYKKNRTDNFNLIEKLYLTEYGQENIEKFIDILNNRNDIESTSKDYGHYITIKYIDTDSTSIDEDISNSPNTNTKNKIRTETTNSQNTNTIAEPINDYILVVMEQQYSFPEKAYEPAYFNAEYVKEVITRLSYSEEKLIDKSKFYRIEKLILTDAGKENIDSFILQLNEREDIYSAERDYAYKNALAIVNPNDTYIMGDSDLDGVITPADARQILRWAVGLDFMTNLNEELCDVDYSGSITPEDARLVLRMSTGFFPQIQY